MIFIMFIIKNNIIVILVVATYLEGQKINNANKCRRLNNTAEDAFLLHREHQMGLMWKCEF